MPARPRGDSPGDGGDRLRIGETSDVAALYPHLYFAPLASLAAFPAVHLVDAALRADHESLPVTSLGPVEGRQRAQPVAQFVVAIDPPHRFDPELSMREPLELQVWPDGAFGVEIEFVGQDVRTHPDAAGLLSEVLAEWADARGWRFVELYNDRGRSLPDVWNATFVMADTSRSVGEAVEFARRAAVVAEAHTYGGESVERLLALLRSGDPEALLGTPVTTVFQPRPALAPGADGDHQLALDVCAFANAVHGGLLVVGLGERGGRVDTVTPGPNTGAVARAERALGRVFPPPEAVLVEQVRAGADGALLVVLVPPQDRVLKPFLVHGVVVDGLLQQQAVTMVERRDTTIYVQGIAALHAQISAGRALLRRDGGPDRPAHSPGG